VLGPGERGVFLATAHPAKFVEVVDGSLGLTPEIPAALAERAHLPVLSETLPPSFERLVERL
jgi:threonine synthase